MITVLVSILVLLGAFFALVAGIGIVRMPGLYLRMHAATKAGSFGVALLLIGLMIAAPGWRTFLEGVAIVAFFYLTAPIGAQMIGRVAVRHKADVWGTELPGEAETQTHNEPEG